MYDTLNSSNGKMDDILPLELFQGIICNIERLKQGTLLLGEEHKLIGGWPNLKGGGRWGGETSGPSSHHDTIKAQLGLGAQPRY